MKFHKKDSGFTLVELLIVMAIIAVLVGITIAGLGFAMRRSRNIARMSAMTNLDRALTSYYSDELEYPIAAADNAVVDFVDTGGVLDQYLEGSWEAPAASEFWYKSDADGMYFTVCVNQEETGTTVDVYNCTGPGIGQPLFPDQADDETCETGGICGFASCCDADGCASGEC